MKFRASCFDSSPDPKFPLFRPTMGTLYAPGLPGDSIARRLSFRPTNYLVRTYSPKGVTENGIYVSKNEKWPRIWAHVLACAPDNPLALNPGDLIVFRRHCEEHLSWDFPIEEDYPGERIPVEVLNYRAVVAVIEDAPVHVRF